MGKLKERLATTITADLVQWVRIENTVHGTVFNSIDNRWPDGTRIRFEFIEVNFWPDLTGHWKSHFIGKTEEGIFFRMKIEHQSRLFNGGI